MATDKWGIPFFYPTGGRKFFWQQGKNALDDDGMIRFGKELDDVEVINESTGEWEFPFVDDAEDIALSGGTGHHTGGEDHGCQGFAYMYEANWEDNPTQFRFRKEMYHSQYFQDPQFGRWTHPKFNFRIRGHGWVGLGWVRYNKKDGISKGKDSVIMEAWGNPDPDSNIKNWIMLKRREDKGGWGKGGDSCGGDSDQVFTWSGIQFRIKSGSSDFSLHPRYPETNDSPVVHCIGKENNDFADNAARGYCYKQDVPRDIEMKFLCKKDNSGDGRVRFKNISLREIDPTKDFDDNPDDPEVPSQPGTTTRIKGNFRVEVDVNQAVNSQCAVAGTSPFYDFLREDEKTLSDSTAWENITRIAAVARNSSSILVGKIIKQLNVNLKKNGTPSDSPVISAKIWDSDNNVKFTSSTTFMPNSDLSGSYAEKSFDFSGNTYTLQSGDQIGIEWTGTSDTHYVVIGIRRANLVDGVNTCLTQYEEDIDNWDDIETFDFSGKMYTSS